MGWKYNPKEIDAVTPERGLDLSTAKDGRRPLASACCHTGGHPAMNAADGANSTPVVTEIYVSEVFVPATVLVTGIALFNGSDATDSVKLALFDAAGTLLRATADTQMSGTDAYQRIAFATDGANGAATTIELPGPATYYVGAIFDGTTSRFNAHAVGSFGGGKVTGAVYATAFNTTSLSITPPTTFTAASLPPIASLY